MKKILVIDDNTGILNAVKVALTFFGHEVRCTEGGMEALQHIETYRPDVIFLDLFLSGENGVDICQKIKAHTNTKNTRVVMMSAHPGAEELIQSSGADAFLAKPFSIIDLEELAQSS